METSDFSAEPQPKASGRGCFLGSWTVIIAIGGMLILAASVLSLLRGDRRLGLEPQQKAIGQKLPLLELQPLTGDAQQVTLPELAGQVVLLNFWGTWCPPCRMEFPHIIALQNKFGDRNDFRLLSISCGRGRDENLDTLREDTRAFLAQQGATLSTYADSDGISRSAVGRLGAFLGYPTTLVLDGTGTIRGVWVGYMPGVEREIEDLIEQLLAASKDNGRPK